MNKKELAKLALRERRAGRNPNRVLAAAVQDVGPAKFDTGEYSGRSSVGSRPVGTPIIDLNGRLIGIPSGREKDDIIEKLRVALGRIAGPINNSGVGPIIDLDGQLIGIPSGRVGEDILEKLQAALRQIVE